jgi:acyl-CoA thioesterase-1
MPTTQKGVARQFLVAAPKVVRILVALFFIPAGAAAAQTIQIVAFGDSGTAGTGTSMQTAYPARLEAMLRAKGRDVTIRNAGIAGETTTDGLRRVDSAVPPGTHIAIIEFGSNDLARGVDHPAIRANMDQIVKRLRSRGTEVLIIGIRGIDYAPVASANNALAVTLGPEFKNYLLPGGKHLTVEGHSAEAAKILPSVEQLIARSKGKRS